MRPYSGGQNVFGRVIMERHRGGGRPIETKGLSFELIELERVRRLPLPGVRVEIVVTSPAHEEMIVFRGSGSPSLVLGTLHKRPDGRFILTREDPVRSLVSMGASRVCATMDDAVSGLDWVLRRRAAPSA